MLHCESRLRAVERERIGPLASAEQQGECDRLCVGVGELRVRGVRKQELTPIPGQQDEGRGVVPQRVGDVVAQHPAQRRQQPGEALEVDPPPTVEREDRLPREKIAQQPLDGERVLLRHCLSPVLRDVAGQADPVADPPAATIQRPLVSITVNEIRNRREPFELAFISSFESTPVGARTRSLEFDMAGEDSTFVDREIRAAQAAGKARLAGADDLEADRVGDARHQGLERRAQLFFGFTGGQASHFRRYGIGENAQRFGDGGTACGHEVSRTAGSGAATGREADGLFGRTQ